MGNKTSGRTIYRYWDLGTLDINIYKILTKETEGVTGCTYRIAKSGRHFEIWQYIFGLHY